jgi:hypothetical protein
VLPSGSAVLRSRNGVLRSRSGAKMPGTFFHHAHRVSHPEKSVGSLQAPLPLTVSVAVGHPERRSP